MSNKKNLLNEATVRRFMTLAGQKSLSENFFDIKDKEIEEGDMAYARDEEPVDLDTPEEEPVDLEEPLEEPEAEGETDISDEEAQVLIDLGKKLEIAQGEEEELAPEEEELPPEEGELELPPEEEEVPLEEIELLDDESVISEVMKRVVTRLANKS